MKELVILSGKGGTGKTSITASFACLAERPVIADCDVDAADLHLVIPPTVRERHVSLLELELQLAIDATNLDVARNDTLPLFAVDFSYSPLGAGNSLGDVLDGQPGVAKRSFGPGTTRPVAMQKPHLRVQPDSLAGGSAIMRQHRVQKRKEGIDRIQRRPEGITLSSTEQSETDSQPTRTMKESMESLPGVVMRQANGPRDFSMMIRGQGAKTTFAVRDVMMRAGVIVRPLGPSVIGICPPLVIDDHDLDRCATALGEAVTAVRSGTTTP